MKNCFSFAEQSALFVRQNGKFFALGRLGLQLTPFRTRGPVRTSFNDFLLPVGDAVVEHTLDAGDRTADPLAMLSNETP